MPSKDFDLTLRDRKTGKTTKARTSIVNFDDEDPERAKAEWERLNPNSEIVEIKYAGDTTQAELKQITEMAPPVPVSVPKS